MENNNPEEAKIKKLRPTKKGEQAPKKDAPKEVKAQTFDFAK